MTFTEIVSVFLQNVSLLLESHYEDFIVKKMRSNVRYKGVAEEIFTER